MGISEAYKDLRNEIPKDVKLICVSKTRQIHEIKEAYAAGARDFGENKAQELMEKHDSLEQDIKWHFIGHLQRNKVKYIVGKVHLIHSLDSIRLLQEIEKQYGAKDEIASVLIQVNIGKEDAKTGIAVSEIDSLIQACEKCNNIKVKGLMATIPIGNVEDCRMYFNEMKGMFDNLKTFKYKNVSMEFLSLGMSGDFEIALQAGSNMIRLGEKIFGRREYKKLEG
ncbi:YggS family pyridoxal phosphate-dependent enzyme [Clostridium tagluense]|uniref:YggS family pyridoxal phosphate-dependent enzyme n=1 Tax=Clostridium tagluense TaxID=360422 RepID=UPI001C0D1240|nr:YggS family pyridoxal phosphate-dependent enzyme [Clostridium tagluense]MBU3126605.1 YggS family pyridoxal phosphate-dependent enzyme [Clostridium tagluense]MCB2309973.1 YggS family pyridoxal phosphate-dependent enzyme [Clostridium tagluense]MCB2314497.1 YggS family pyridoxal phosphate-dependent enzyme [Clostridium tagluense]MCB2319345.1 YggS family pyridoxal phosphate-dependent enzyme [Clostridium tagluense]MCB2324567.1 YggS family pyridoxal phosphate-dependent enzyme [Clostridium tagluens